MMKIKISKKTKRILGIYLAAVAILYIVVFQVPKVTDKFETTQVLENGTLEVSCEAKVMLSRMKPFVRRIQRDNRV